MGGNLRCVRNTSSANYLTFMASAATLTVMVMPFKPTSCGNCAMPNFAAYGAILSIIDETCRCYNGIRGQAALIPEVPIEPIANNERLDTNPLVRSVKSTANDLPATPLLDDMEIVEGHASLGTRITSVAL